MFTAGGEDDGESLPWVLSRMLYLFALRSEA